RLPAARGPQESEELTVADSQAEVVDRRRGPAVDLGDVLEVDRIHVFLPSWGRAPPAQGGARRGRQSCSAVVLDAAGPVADPLVLGLRDAVPVQLHLLQTELGQP